MNEYKIVITRYQDIKHEAGIKTSYQNTHKKDDKGEDIWEYIPKAAHTETTFTEVFTQRLPEIDVLAVVAAINGVKYDR